MCNDFTVIDYPKLGVLADEGYSFLSCMNGEIEISYRVQDKIIIAHYAGTKKALRYMKKTLKAACEYLFKICPGTKMILSVLDPAKPGLLRMAEKLGFTYLFKTSRVIGYALLNPHFWDKKND